MDVIDAWEGYARSKGITQPEEQFMTREELEELMQRFPDNPHV
jgi:hypothetical protein